MRDWQSQAHVRWYCRYHVVIVPTLLLVRQLIPNQLIHNQRTGTIWPDRKFKLLGDAGA